MTGTYRLQMNAAFTFAEAQRHVPYFRDLGISHLYLSPVWQALPGSQHGYDVLDHARINEQLGGLDGFIEFARAVHEAGLKIIADIVPNHVSIGGVRNPWWRDVLRLGPASSFAPYFDIDWRGRGGAPGRVVVLPVLGKPFGVAIEEGELGLRLVDGELVAAYFEQTFPLSPASYATVLGQPPAGPGNAEFAEAARIAHELRTASPASAVELLAAFRRTVGGSPAAGEWIEARCRSFEGKHGCPSSWDSLERLLNAQHYRLAHWRVSGEQINYRRFFDVNSLAGVRMEHQPAFDATHPLVAELTRQGHVDGLRIDHIDGLHAPNAYIAQLRALCPGVPLWLEKILAEDEALPDWPVCGTTGYDFPAAVESLFYDPEGRDELVAAYREFTGESVPYETVEFESRRSIADRAFSGDLNALAEDLHGLAQGSRRHRDLTVRSVRESLTALLACFPQYRTYSDADGPSESDRLAIRTAADIAHSRASDTTLDAVAFIVDILAETGPHLDVTELTRRHALIARFQQISSPVMAKGVEDTAFYRYTPFLAQNEVGGSPGAEPRTAARVHEWLAARAREPFTLNATSTHDTKRSEDARMRLAVLTEVPEEWRSHLYAWAELNRGAKRPFGADLFPPAHTEHYLYQSLVASWDGDGGSEYVERIRTHMRKASREAKLWTSWMEPDDGREIALDHFISDILSSDSGAQFRERLAAFVECIRPAAESNSLALLALKCLAPGVPDFYQGSEGWLLTLTDPDNRGPVDFDEPQRRLRNAGADDAKLVLMRGLLQLRAARPGIFGEGTYESLALRGPIASHAFAFARRSGGEEIVVLIRRSAGGLSGPIAESLRPLADASSVSLPPGRWFDWLTGKSLTASNVLSGLAEAPVVVLTSFKRPAK